MSQTAVRGMGVTIRETANRHRITQNAWRLLETSGEEMEYASLAELHCGDLATMPVFLTLEQADSLEEISRRKLSGPRGKMEMLPEE